MMAFTLNVFVLHLRCKIVICASNLYLFSWKIDKPVSAPHVTIKKYYDGNDRIYGYNTWK